MSEQSDSRRPGSFRNLVFALIFVAISGAMGINAYTTMNIGTAANMGPGFFPVMLSIVLALLAVLVGFTSIPADAPPLQLAKIKSAVLVIVSPLIFAATIRSLGLALCIFITVFVVSFASRHATLKQSLILSGTFAVFCVLLFRYLLNLPIPVWGTLFQG